MKHVFIETNFLVGVLRPMADLTALGLLGRHDSKQLLLYVPWCSVTEVKRTLGRGEIVNEDLGFEKAMQRIALEEFPVNNKTAPPELLAVQKLASLVASRRKQYMLDLDTNIQSLAAKLNVIEPSQNTVDETMRLWETKQCNPFDEMITGAVVAHARTLKTEGKTNLHFCSLDRDVSSVGPGREKLNALYEEVGITFHANFDVT